MSSYFITGKLGSGKTLVAVGRIFEYLRQGRKVATNLDIYLDKYLYASSKKSIMRIPDKPTLLDLEMIGSGNDTPIEENNGLLVLDELGSWFNARSWQDKDRKPLLDWFIHARKHGWDVFLIVQDISMVDAQLRGMLGEHLVICKRFDRIKIPFVGGFMQMLGLKGLMPKIHSARVFYGEDALALPVDRWVYRGKHFYDVYNTKQVFSPDYANGVFSLLSPWHTVGRYKSPEKSLQDLIDDYLKAELPKLPPKPKLKLIRMIERLPCPEARIQFFKRFQQCGAL